MKSMRPPTWPHRPPVYAMPTTNQSAIGRCSAVTPRCSRPGRWIDVGEYARRDERHGQPAESAFVEAPLPDEIAGQEGQHEETQIAGRSRRPGPIGSRRAPAP